MQILQFNFKIHDKSNALFDPIEETLQKGDRKMIPTESIESTRSSSASGPRSTSFGATRSASNASKRSKTASDCSAECCMFKNYIETARANDGTLPVKAPIVVVDWQVLALSNGSPLSNCGVTPLELGVPNATGFWQMLDDGERNISFKTQLAVVASPSLGAKK